MLTNVIRCPYCKLPMTETEAVAGQCPMCGGAIDAEGRAVETDNKEPQTTAQVATPSSGNRFWIIGTVVGLLLLIGLWYVFFNSGDLESGTQPPESKSGGTIAQAKPQTQGQKTENKSDPAKLDPKEEDKKTDKGHPKSDKVVPSPMPPTLPQPEPIAPPQVTPPPIPPDQDAGFSEVKKLDDPNGEYTVASLHGGKKIKLRGTVGTLKVGEINNRSLLDASALSAKKIILTRSINSGSSVLLNAPGGRVVFQGDINAQSSIQVNAPDGVVVFGNTPEEPGPGGGHINGESQVALIAREVEIRGAVNGPNTQVLVSLSRGGKLKVERINGGVQLLYKSLDPTGPAPIIETGSISSSAELKKIE